MTRFDIQRYYPAMQPLVGLGQRIAEAGRLEPALIELVLMRASQINGCAFCLDMHSKDARAKGETEQRLYLLPAWRETVEVARAAAAAVPLGYLGVDIVVDRGLGPLGLEVNARPGREIQNVHGRGLAAAIAQEMP